MPCGISFRNRYWRWRIVSDLFSLTTIMDFKISSKFQPTGDQPEAIRQLTDGVMNGERAQVLLGVTGSGKTFTMANVIANVGRPTLILSHNKTLAAQLYEEMKSFFPDNAVEYYVSYYDYYQPEAYLPSSDTYIEKDLAINEDIDKLRLSAVSALLSGRKDVVVVSSVSCIYGMGGPTAMANSVISVKKGDIVERNAFLRKLVDALYLRNDIDLTRGTFRVKGDTVDVFMAYSDNVLRITWWDDEIDSIEEVDSVTFKRIAEFADYKIYPANLFVTSKEQTESAIRLIQDDLLKQIDFFESVGDHIRAQRIKERVEYDMEMIKELGHCSGIENYSRYFDGREPGQRPYCLLDFFPKDFLMFIDESHVSVPQISAMYGGDRARKQNLVEYGFRLPAAFDNRAKNTYLWVFNSTSLIRAFQDDLDSILPFDNQGKLTKPYWVEEHDFDTSLGKNYWNGEDNALYNLMEESFPTDLRSTMKEILSAMARLGDGTVQGCWEKYFMSTCQYFPAVAYNEFARIGYEYAHYQMVNGNYNNDTDPITQSLGSLSSLTRVAPHVGCQIRVRIHHALIKNSHDDRRITCTGMGSVPIR